TNLTFTGQFTGHSNLIKSGPGTLTLSNGTNNYTGSTRVKAGMLALGAATALPSGSNLSIDTIGEFNTGGFTNTAATALNSLTLNGGIFRHSAGGGTFFMNQITIGPAGGNIDESGAGGVNVTGAGITVNGNSNWSGAASAGLANSS